MIIEVLDLFDTVYSKLESNQESLGHEFQQILYENIWDLYEE